MKKHNVTPLPVETVAQDGLDFHLQITALPEGFHIKVVSLDDSLDLGTIRRSETDGSLQHWNDETESYHGLFL